MSPTDDDEAEHARRVGVEIEFSGLDVEAAGAAVVIALGGHARHAGDYRRTVEGTTLGDFVVELDFELLQAMNARRRGEEPVGIFAEMSEDLLAAASEPLVPVEVISPPIPIPRLGELDRLTQALRDAGAQGTRGSFLYAFGLHMNPELRGLGADTIRDHVRAYLCLHDWLVEHERVDWSRRLTPHIRSYPREYLCRVLAADYAPELGELIDDYLFFNPDRNRALDLLPLFAYLDEARVRAAVDDPRIKARPTFHYRLPNCEIDQPDWSIAPAWRRWLEVEALAADPRRLAETAGDYLAYLGNPLEAISEGWVARVERRLREV